MEREKEPGLGWADSLGPEVSNPATPRTSGETIYALVCKSCQGEKCEKCDDTGKQRWTVSPCENRIKGQFEEWVRSRARKCVAEVEDAGDILEADRMRDVYQVSYAAGHYAWDGKHTLTILKSMLGYKYLLFLLLRRCHPDVTERQAGLIFAADMRQAMGAISWALGNVVQPVESKAGETNGTAERTMTRAQWEAEKTRAS